MTVTSVESSVTKTMRWGGFAMSALPALALLASGVLKLIGGPGLAEGFSHLGWPISIAVPLGLLELACTLLYLAPRTSVLGAILLTGYLGGAIATHVRIGEAFFLQAIFGVFVWGGLYLRDPRLHSLIPLNRASDTTSK